MNDAQAPLPPMFLVAAEALLTAGGRDASTPNRLLEFAPDIAALLTPENLVARRSDLINLALNWIDRAPTCQTQTTRDALRITMTRILTRGAVKDSDIDELYCDAAPQALEIGLVAGYLLTRALAEAGGVR